MTSQARKPVYCGWGYPDDGLSPDEERALRRTFADRFGAEELPQGSYPKDEDIELREPRAAPPKALNSICSTDRFDRLSHTYGQSYPDYVRMLAGDFGNAADLVAWARTEDDVAAVLDWAADKKLAVIPYGGGTSVVGGVEPQFGGEFAGAVSLDLTGLDQVLEVDRESRAARIQGGIRGPAMEAGLRPHDLTMRHFPQSFELATLGGMIATRSGGHFATRYTHIDDFVEQVRCVTPTGVIESRRLPGSGAGPSPDRLLIGSEGALGVITEAWMRLQDRPTFRSSDTVLFDSMEIAVAAIREISQAAIYPANLRLLDPQESALNGFGDGKSTMVVLGFENADHPVDEWAKRALEICADHGGRPEGSGQDADAHKSGSAGAWRAAFIRMPHLRKPLVAAGIIHDTFETAITWDRFADFQAQIEKATKSALREVTGRDGFMSTRFTHVYPDGPAPYYTFMGLGRPDALLEQWGELKRAVSDAVIENGGTITHHHAVGRDHMPWYRQQRPDLHGRALGAVKATLDPVGVLNPGVLVAD